MIEFVECSKIGYKPRTEQNIVETDATIMIYWDGMTAGEKLTRKLCIEHNKPRFEIDFGHLVRSDSKLYTIIPAFLIWFNSNNPERINVAGNGIYTWSKAGIKTDQTRVNEYVGYFLYEIVDKIKFIQSGGQSGTDEAAIHFAIQNNIPARIVAPKGWSFRLQDNKDIYDEKRFKERFE